jgi:hypothetical protein
VFLGTSRGVRFCVPSQTGDLNVGALVETTGPVRCFINWDRFVWFGWSDYDATSTGLGRLDPSATTDDLVPAYASDVLAAANGVVNSVAILPGAGTHAHPVFTIDANGVWRCIADTPVASGELRTGLISYGLADPKIAAFLDMRHSPLPAGTSVSVQLIPDEGSAVQLGVSNAPGSIDPGPLDGQQKRAELFELVFTLNKFGSTSPTLRRWTLRSLPAPARPSSWTLPLMFSEKLLNEYDREFPFEPLAELAFLRTLRDTHRIVTFQWGEDSFNVVVDSYTYLINRNTGGASVPQYNWTGILVVTLNQVSG